jgi:hypothetical protein
MDHPENEEPEEPEDPREPCPHDPKGVHEDILERDRNEYPDGHVEYIVISVMCRRCGATARFDE